MIVVQLKLILFNLLILDDVSTDDVPDPVGDVETADEVENPVPDSRFAAPSSAFQNVDHDEFWPQYFFKNIFKKYS